MPTYRAGVIGLGRMGSTFDDEITQGGSLFLPYCHGPTYHAAQNIRLVAGADPHHADHLQPSGAEGYTAGGSGAGSGTL